MSQRASRAAPSTNPLISSAALVVLAMIVFVVGVAMGARGWDAAVLGLALITTLVGTLPIIIDQTRPIEKRKLLIALTALVYMLFLVVPVFTQYFLLKGEYRPGFFTLVMQHPADIAHGQAVALLGLATLLVGFYLPIGSATASILPMPRRDWSSDASLIVSLVTLGLGWSVYLAGQFGMIPSRAGSGAVGTIANGWYFGISLLTLTWLRDRRPASLMSLWIIVPLAMMFNFFTGSKRLFLTAPFMVALAFIVFERRIRRSWVIAGFLLLIFLYPTAQFYRDVVQESYTLSAAQILQDPGRALNQISGFMSSMDMAEYFRVGLEATGSRLDALGVLTVIVRDTPERVPYQGGWTLGYIALSYVPRVLWPDKPHMTIGDWVSQNYGSPYDLRTDVGPSWVGEFFFNWGYLGVGLGMFVLGILFRVCQELFFGWKAPIPAMFAACIVLYAAPRAVQGGLISPINGTIYNLVPVLAAHLVVSLVGGLRRPERPTGPEPAGSSPRGARAREPDPSASAS